MNKGTYYITRQRLVREYYQHYANKLQILEKLKKFLKNINLQKLSQEEIERTVKELVF